MAVPDPIAAAVLRQLNRRRMTITQLADVAEVDRSVLSHWLCGTRQLRLAAALRVMEVLRIVPLSPEDLHDAGTHRPQTPKPRPPRL